MTEKNIFAYKLFLLLNISDFNLLFLWKLQSPWKKSPPYFPATPSKRKSRSCQAVFENLVEGSTPHAQGGGGGAHYVFSFKKQKMTLQHCWVNDKNNEAHIYKLILVFQQEN